MSTTSDVIPDSTIPQISTEKKKKSKPTLSINVETPQKVPEEKKEPLTGYLSARPRTYGLLRRPSAEPTFRHSS
jgi:hypothetical protein